MDCIYFETILNDFCLQISCDAKYFFHSCSRSSEQGLIVVIVYYFQIWNQKERNIIICRVISNHITHVYWDTLYIYMYIYIYWERKKKREREREKDIYIYIYILREREREREREKDIYIYIYIYIYIHVVSDL